MDLRKLKTLIDLVSESNVSELEITEAEGKVRIVKGGVAPVMAPVMAPVAMPAVAAPMPEATAAAAPAAPPVQAESAGHAVKSPMVGTFYAAPEPGAAPFVQPGQSVRVGDVLCIIEVMKLMNTLRAEFDGTVREVAVRDAHPVEYGQVLMQVEPA